MEDTALIDLYWQRDETAIEATAAKYGGLCGSIEKAQTALADMQQRLQKEAALRARLEAVISRLG